MSIIPTPCNVPSIQHPMITRSKVGFFKPKIYVVDLFEIEPHTIKQTLSHVGWHQSMIDEYEAFTGNNTWVLIPPPCDMKIIDSKWVF